jgi:hypothetical protein
MVYPKPAIADLVRAFPQLTSSRVWENSADHDGQWYEFARLVASLYQKENYDGVRSAFDRLEEFLADGSPGVRNWVAGFFQALQDISSWGSGDSDAFRRFLGPNAQHVWETLDAIRFDLAACSTLEAEILMWRVVHHKVPPHVGDTRQLS